MLSLGMILRLKPETAGTGGADGSYTPATSDETFKTLHPIIIYRRGMWCGCGEPSVSVARGLLSGTRIMDTSGAGEVAHVTHTAPTPQPATLGFSCLRDSAMVHSTP